VVDAEPGWVCGGDANAFRLLLFGWGLSVWSIIALVALVRLLRTERHQPTTPMNASHPVVQAFVSEIPDRQRSMSA
jgi:choline-glycine betaine transporter